MKLIGKLLLVLSAILLLSACNGNKTVDHFSTLKKCTILGDDSIIYARAHYVTLFHKFNPKKFAEPYDKVKGFDAVTLRNTIDTYTRAVNKIQTDVETTEYLISACSELAEFSRNFVDNDYPLANKHQSKENILSDGFFTEINQIVKFDDSIGTFDKNQRSFKQIVDNYHQAVADYIELYQEVIPAEFVEQRFSDKSH